MNGVLRWVIVGVLCLAVSCEDYYKELELEKGEDSTETDIKKAFRKLSRIYHPDINKADEAKERFTRINKAYEVLSDAKKRKVYDMKGEEGLKQLEGEKNGRGDMMDPFAAFFGGGQRDRTRGQDLTMNLKVNLDDVYNGNSHKITWQKQKLCRACKGSGARTKGDMITCNRCQGKGVVLQRVQLAPGFVQQIQNHCDECGGTGKKIKRKCPTCSGQKVTRGDTTLEVLIERGIPEGHEVKFEMEADESPDILPGDVIFRVNTNPHRVFRREGNDLHMTLKITLLQALVGFSHTLQHLDGHEVIIAKKDVTPHGTRKTLKGEGMPHHNVPSEFGNLVVTFEVEFPDRVTAEQAEGFRKLLVR